MQWSWVRQPTCLTPEPPVHLDVLRRLSLSDWAFQSLVMTTARGSGAAVAGSPRLVLVRPLLQPSHGVPGNEVLSFGILAHLPTAACGPEPQFPHL